MKRNKLSDCTEIGLELPFPILLWRLERLPAGECGLFSQSLKDDFLFYAGNMFSRLYHGVVVNGDAINAGTYEKFCEVW